MTLSYDGHGRLTSSATAITSTSTTAAATNYLSFDGLGRVTSSSQVLTGAAAGTWPFSRYDYNLADGLTNITYPSGRTVTTSFDPVSGLPQGVTGTLNGTPSTYASSVTYAPHGPVQSVTMGNHLVETTIFNERLQATQIQAGSLLTLNFDYVHARRQVDHARIAGS